MSRIRRLFVGLLVLCLMLPMGLLEAQAEQYTYTVTFYPGNHGSFQGLSQVSVDNSKSGSSYQVSGGGSAITVSGLCKEDVVSFDAAMEGALALSNDSKYYVKGIRQSGRDNNTVDQVRSNSILVESDRDFVVAYGIKGDMVAYHVNYQDEAGNSLAPSETYFGNVGDKPVMAFLYIEGYEPQAYNLTRTLVSDESKNEFTFVYRRTAAGTTTTVTDGGTNTVIVPGSVNVISGESGATGGTGTGGTAEGGTGTEGEEAAEGEDNTTTIPDAAVPQGPGELMDLDDEEVPLAGIRDLIINSEGRFVYGASIIIGLSAAAALITMGIMMWKKRREHAYE